MGKAMRLIGQSLILAAVVVVVIYPLYQVVILSLMDREGIAAYIQQVQNRTLRFIPGYFWPRMISPEQYILAANDAFRRAYGVAILYTLAVTLLQFPFALGMGFVFSKIKFKGRDFLFYLYLAAMVLPFHVTVVPMHQLLHHMRLFDTPWAVILPGVFSPLGVFLVRQFFMRIPDELLESAAIEGAGIFRTLRSIMIPLARNGLAIFFLLVVSLQWAAIEPALAFIRSQEWQPVSLMLRTFMEHDQTMIFASGILFMVPMLVLFAIIGEFEFVTEPTANV